ncbi:MAG: STAS domain-containing protein [Chloroflexaceae bacterium]|nr:STAS domain-containing protein [Chloroflexaceae bacterium]
MTSTSSTTSTSTTSTVHPEQTQALNVFPDFFEYLPIGVQVYGLEGTLLAFNRAYQETWGITREAWIGRYNAYTDEQSIKNGVPEVFDRVAQGETITAPPLSYDSRRAEVGVVEGRHAWVQPVFFPIRDRSGTVQAIGVVTRDVTAEIEQREALEKARFEIAAQREVLEATQQELEQARTLEAARREIAAQRETIMALSTPVVQMWEKILVMPLVGVIDSHRALTIMETLLEAISRHHAENVILDITGVPMVDTQVANYLLSTVRACQLLGCEVALVGISAEIAQTIVHLGVDLDRIVTRANLQAGISWAFMRQNLVVVRRDAS